MLLYFDLVLYIYLLFKVWLLCPLLNLYHLVLVFWKMLFNSKGFLLLKLFFALLHFLSSLQSSKRFLIFEMEKN